MNKFFVQDVESNKVTLTKEQIPELEDQWVVIKEKLSTKDQSNLQSRLYSIEIEQTQLSRAERRRQGRQNNQATQKITMNSQVPIVLELAILDWSFTDDETGAKIPVTFDNIEKLLPIIADGIYDAVDQNNPL